jgi:predicted HTH transcriptional regulator
MNLQDLEQIIIGRESETVKFKKSTAQLTPAGETLSAFLLVNALCHCDYCIWDGGHQRGHL